MVSQPVKPVPKQILSGHVLLETEAADSAAVVVAYAVAFAVAAVIVDCGLARIVGLWLWAMWPCEVRCLMVEIGLMMYLMEWCLTMLL